MSTITIDGVPIAPCLVGTNVGLNYGRFFGAVEHPYEARIPVTELGWLAAAYREAALEMESDDQFDDEPSPYVHVAYDPDLRRGLQSPAALAAIIEYFFDRDVLAHHFPCRNGQTRYIINATDRVRIADGSLVIHGRCWQV